MLNDTPFQAWHLVELKTGSKRDVYPWKTMAIGECFKFRGHVTVGSARVLASRSGERFWPKKFRTKRLFDGIFCFRIE